MSITLPLGNQRWARFRLLTAKNWGGVAASTPNWQTEPLENPGGTPFPTFGYILHEYTRAVLPQIGTAKFAFRYGRFGDKVYGASESSRANLEAGGQWDPATDKMTLPDLRNKEIRIQVNYPDENGVVVEADWKTVFWGTCEYQIDEPWGGSDVPAGQMVYHCFDAFHRTKRWYVNRHGFLALGGGAVSPAAGHPGFNVSPQTPSITAGNKDPGLSTWEPTSGEGVYATYAVMPGTGDAFTDEEVVNDSIAIGRPSNQPLWTMSGTVELFAGSSPWTIDPNESVYSIVTRVCARGRGRGSVLPSWTESSPTGPLTATLIAYPQLTDDISYTNPSTGSTTTLPGATTEGTTLEIDLIGDHRLPQNGLKVGDAQQYQVDYLESYGEQIEVMGTVEYSTTLEKGWSTTDQTAFLALPTEERVDEKWNPVFCMHRLKRNFAMSLSNGNGAAQINADYRCSDAGAITTDPGALGGSASDMIVVMDDIPLWEGYKLAGAALARVDGASAATYGGSPQRKPPLILMRVNQYEITDKYIKREVMEPQGWQFKVQPDGLYYFNTKDIRDGNRTIGDTASNDVISVYDYTDLVMTLGFRLPHRVRMANGDSTKPRHKLLYHRGIHLWLAAPNCIYDTDSPNHDATDDTYLPALRPGGASAIIIRDDRDALALLHNLARSWYGTLPDKGDTSLHRGAEWSLRCCGDVPTAAGYDGGGVIYGELGKVVTELTANGQIYYLNTPISSMSYDNTTGLTTWTTDWEDLDFRGG